MSNLIKTNKSLMFSLIGTILVILVLSYLTIVKRTEVSEFKLLLTEQVDRLAVIHDKEFSVNGKALSIAKANRETVATEYKALIKELSVYYIPVVKMTATRFKAMLQDKLAVLSTKRKAAGIEFNESKLPSFSVKDLTQKKESSYQQVDFTKGSEKIAIISRLTDVLIDAKISKVDFLSWREVKEEGKSSFVSDIHFELTIMGTQESIENTVTSLSSDQLILFFIKAVECQNSTVLAKPTTGKGKEVDLSSKESRELKKDNQLTCKLYVKVIQFHVDEQK